jgi:hypothetical protein
VPLAHRTSIRRRCNIFQQVPRGPECTNTFDGAEAYRFSWGAATAGIEIAFAASQQSLPHMRTTSVLVELGDLRGADRLLRWVEKRRNVRLSACEARSDFFLRFPCKCPGFAAERSRLVCELRTSIGCELYLVIANCSDYA